MSDGVRNENRTALLFNAPLDTMCYSNLADIAIAEFSVERTWLLLIVIQ